MLSWNKRATSSKFLNELIFIVISPAYALCGVADLFVVNTIEFWSGSNPLEANIGTTEQVLGCDGRLYAVTTLADGYEVRDSEGNIVNFVHDGKDDSWSVVKDGKTTKLLRIKDKDTAEIYLKDGSTLDVALNEQGVSTARMAVNGGLYFAFR